MADNINIFWFRQDLRITDNPGLYQAAQQGLVMPVYIFDDEVDNNTGGAAKWWLHHSLGSLNQSLGGKLNFYIGDPKEVLLNIAEKHNIKAIYWNRCYEPYRVASDVEVQQKMVNINVDCHNFNGSLLWEPWDILKEDGTNYKVFTHFYKNGCLKAKAPRIPLSRPKQLNLFKDENNQCNIDDFKLLDVFKWYTSIEGIWEIGELAANKKLINFLNNYLIGYKEGRNYPDKPHVSRLSPHIRFGEISPNQVWYAAKNHNESIQDLGHFLTELGWREFAYYVLYNFPQLPFRSFQSKFARFAWKNDLTLLKAWQTGQTGYPLVDAGMRELWQTGYIHNRVRMIVGCFLVKNLSIHWRYGARWFLDCLVDADLASNSAGWQWVAGSGLDAVPYFRIFNPMLQGEKFDPDGKYTKSFVPELKRMPTKYLFRPWEAPPEVLRETGIVLGRHYPNPIISFEETRKYALAAYKQLNILTNSMNIK